MPGRATRKCCTNTAAARASPSDTACTQTVGGGAVAAGETCVSDGLRTAVCIGLLGPGQGGIGSGAKAAVVPKALGYGVAVTGLGACAFAQLVQQQRLRQPHQRSEQPRHDAACDAACNTGCNTACDAA